MMNLYILTTFDLNSKGINIYIKELISSLDTSNFHLHVIILHSASPKDEIMFVVQEGVSYWHIPNPESCYEEMNRESADYTIQMLCIY